MQRVEKHLSSGIRQRKQEALIQLTPIQAIFKTFFPNRTLYFHIPRHRQRKYIYISSSKTYSFNDSICPVMGKCQNLESGSIFKTWESQPISTWCVQVLRSPKEAFTAAMQSWRERCEKCVCLHGDYLEN